MPRGQLITCWGSARINCHQTRAASVAHGSLPGTPQRMPRSRNISVLLSSDVQWIARRYCAAVRTAELNRRSAAGCDTGRMDEEVRVLHCNGSSHYYSAPQRAQLKPYVWVVKSHDSGVGVGDPTPAPSRLSFKLSPKNTP